MNKVGLLSIAIVEFFEGNTKITLLGHIKQSNIRAMHIYYLYIYLMFDVDLFRQTTNRGKSPNIAKGYGNDGLLSDLTRLLNEDGRDFRGDFGRGFPANIQKGSQFDFNADIHSSHPPPHVQQYYKPSSQDPTIFSNSIKPSFIPAPIPSPPKVNSLGNFIDNSIGGAFYDPKHDLVVSYKVSRYV